MNEDGLNQFKHDLVIFQVFVFRCLLSQLLGGRTTLDKSELFEMYLLGQNTSPYFNVVYGYAVECRGGKIFIRDMYAHHKVVFEADVE